MIVRAKRPDRGFTILDNAVLRDRRLTYRASGLLAEILSRPDDWRTDSTTLARHAREGREAIRSALRELEQFGYLTRTQGRDDKGRWVTITTVYDTPQGAPADEPGAQESVVGQPGVGDLGAIRSTETNDCDEDELSRPDAAHRATSDIKPKERSNWRQADRKLWRDIIGQDVLYVIDSEFWNPGKFTTDAFYDAFRKGAHHTDPKHWPGRFLDTMDDWEDWLLAKGVALEAAS